MRRLWSVATTAAGVAATIVASGRATFQAGRIGDRSSDAAGVVAIDEGMIVPSCRASTIRHDADGVCSLVHTLVLGQNLGAATLLSPMFLLGSVAEACHAG
jgi:hypothetical protein